MKLKTLDEIGNIQTGTTPKTSEPENFGDYIPFIKPSDFNADGTLCLESCEYLSEIGIGKGRLIPKHSVLMTCIGSIGKCGYNDIDVSCNQQINALTPHTDNYKYIYYVMKSGEFQTRIQNICPKTVVPIINKTLWGKLEISLPSREEQDKIVSILDKADEIRAKKKLANDKLDEFLKSTFISMFGDPIKNEMNWKTENLSSVAPIKSYSGNVEKFNGKYWLLNLDVVESNTGKILEYNYEASIPNSTCCFNGDMVLYSKLRPYLNKVVLPNKTGYATSELVPLNPVKEKLNKYFLASLLRSKCFVDDINIRVAGAKMPRVSMDYLRNFPIILPPIEDQNKFAQIVEHVGAQKQKNELVIEQMNNLFNSLSQRAFKGEL